MHIYYVAENTSFQDPVLHITENVLTSAENMASNAEIYYPVLKHVIQDR